MSAEPIPIERVPIERVPIEVYAADPEVGAYEPRPATSWTPRDLTAVAGGDDVAPPRQLRRTDGIALLYDAAVNWVQGPPESMKSMLIAKATAQVITAGGRVLYIDFEDNEHTLIARLTALGVSVDQIAQHVTYLRPDEPLMISDKPTPALVDLQAVLDSGPFDLAAIDGVTESMTVEGLALIDNSDVATWMRLLPKRIADHGAAVVCIDHVVKTRDERGRYALGAQHKLAAVTGAAYTIRVLKPLARATSATEVTGTVLIDVVKDRPGHVRGTAHGDTIAVLNATSWPDGGLTLHLEPPDTHTIGPDMTMVLELLEHLHTYPGATGANIVSAVKGREQDKRSALKWMADPARAWIRIEQAGRSHLHHLTATGHKELAR